MADNEKFHVVDEDDNPLFCVKGKTLLHSINKPHRAIHVIIETFGGGIILQRKASGTENAGKLSSSVSGHVRSSETYKRAAVREIEEELGLKVSPNQLTFVGKISPCKDTDNEFVVVYSYLADENEKKKLGTNQLSEEVEAIILTSIVNLVDHIKVNTSEYSPAFIRVFNEFI